MKNKIRVFVGLLLLFIGGLIFLYPNLREVNTWLEIKNVQKEIIDMRKDEISTNEKSNKSLYDEIFSYNQELTETGQNIRDAFAYEDSPIVLTGSENTAFGYITIPSIGCELPLYIGASEDNLSKGAAVIGGTSMPVGGENTNCVIAAHRGYLGSAFFRDIASISEGEMVYITNPWGTLCYKAVSAEVVEPYETEAMEIEPGKDIVTLVSCHPYQIGGGPLRYIVKCERSESRDSTYTAKVETNDIKEDNVVYKDSESENLFEKDSTGDNSLIRIEIVLRIILPILLVIMAVKLLQKNKHQ